MASLPYQNFIFFLGSGRPQTRFSSNVVFIFQKSLNVWKAICLEAKHVIMVQLKKEMCHLKAEKNELNHSGCLLSQILFLCFVCLCICIFFSFYYPTLSLFKYVCSNPIMIIFDIFSMDGHHLAFYMTEHNYSVFCNQKQGSTNANLSGNLYGAT